jgi:hypothetical protein
MPVVLFWPKSTLTSANVIINKAEELPFVKFKTIRFGFAKRIGKIVGYHNSSVSREVRRNLATDADYKPEKAQACFLLSKSLSASPIIAAHLERSGHYSLTGLVTSI